MILLIAIAVVVLNTVSLAAVYSLYPEGLQIFSDEEKQKVNKLKRLLLSIAIIFLFWSIAPFLVLYSAHLEYRWNKRFRDIK